MTMEVLEGITLLYMHLYKPKNARVRPKQNMVQVKIVWCAIILLIGSSWPDASAHLFVPRQSLGMKT